MGTFTRQNRGFTFFVHVVCAVGLPVQRETLEAWGLGGHGDFGAGPRIFRTLVTK